MELISRAEARRKGLKRFFSGVKCKNGHLTWRIVSNGGCLECKRIQSGIDYQLKKHKNSKSLLTREHLDFIGVYTHLIHRKLSKSVGK